MKVKLHPSYDHTREDAGIPVDLETAISRTVANYGSEQVGAMLGRLLDVLHASVLTADEVCEVVGCGYRPAD